MMGLWTSYASMETSADAKPEVWYRKVHAFRFIPRNQEDGYISIDGERVPFVPFQAEVHRGLGTVLSKNGHFYEAPGPD